jgi:hypothetical protein
MISNLIPEEQKDWQRQMTRYARRQKRQMRWETIKRVAAPVVLVACLIVTVCTCWPGNGPPVKAVVVDSTISDSFWSPSGAIEQHMIINPEIQREYDSIVASDTIYMYSRGQSN